MYTHVHSSTIHNNQKVEAAQADKWINQTLYMDAIEYYSAFKRKETLTPATTWMDLEDVILSEISQ